MSQGTNPTYNGEGKTTLLNMIHSAPDKAELTGYKPYITGVLTSGDATDDAFLRNHLGRVYYSSLHYAGLDNLIGDSVDGSFRPITLTGLYEGTPSAGSSAHALISLLLHFDGSDGATTTTDDGPDERTITLAGDAELDTAQKKFGTASLLLDGDGDLASAADDGDFDFGSGDFTVEGFFRISTLGNNAFFSHWENNDTSGQSFYLVHFNSSNTLRFAYRLTTGLVEANYTWQPSTNTFYHIAVVRYGTTLKVYIDGVAVISESVSTTSFITSEDPFRIGAFNDATTASPTLDWFFAGHVDEVRVTKGQARYIDNFVPTTSAFEATDATAQTQDPHFSNVKLLGSFDGSDAATSASDDAGLRTLTFSNGAALSTSVKKFGTASLKIDPDDNQANAKVLTESTSDFAFGTDDFTIELWFYKTVNAYGFLFDMRGGADTTGTDGLYVTMGGGGNTELDLGLNRSNIIRTNMDAISNDQWHHYAVTKASNTYRVFIDGALQASASNSTNLDQDKPMMIGNYHGNSSGGGFSFNGYIDEVRVTKGTARYTAAFAAPSAAFLES
jgi:hypothetical protein